jgi:hypothetical protein
MSECIGICQIDPESDICIGCGRSSDQIFGNDESYDPTDGEAAEQIPHTGHVPVGPDDATPEPGG